MKFKADGYNWIVRLEKGEQLLENLTKLIKEQNVPSCWISGIGAVQEVELGYYNLENKTYEWHTVHETMEITALGGNLAFDGTDPVLHLHGTFSKQDLSVIGGHVKDFVTAGTCEIFLHRWYNDRLSRNADAKTGLNLLNL